MKKYFLIFFILLGQSQAACLPDSDFLGYSSDTAHFISSGSMREAEDAIETFDSTMQEILPDKHDLVIRVDALNPRVNADINKIGNEVVISVMGGMLRHSKMRPEVLQLLLCHELGHLLGGPPLKSRNGWSSTEGQADYYAGYTCARMLGFNSSMFLDAALELTTIYAEVVRQAPPKLNQCDESVAERTNFGYPSVQCRLDTMIAGWNQMDRPLCWFR